MKENIKIRKEESKVLYEKFMDKSKKRFYTYVIIRPWNNLPAYVGKGCGNRKNNHEISALKKTHYNRHLQNVFLKSEKLGLKPRVWVVMEDLTEEAAFAAEKELIQRFGRKDLGLGSLCNLTDGGEGMSNPSTQTRKKLSDSHKNPSQETRDKMSKRMTGPNNHRYGVPVPKDIKRKISQSLIGKTGRPTSDKTRKILSELRKGENNPMSKKNIALRKLKR